MLPTPPRQHPHPHHLDYCNSGSAPTPQPVKDTFSLWKSERTPRVTLTSWLFLLILRKTVCDRCVKTHMCQKATESTHTKHTSTQRSSPVIISRLASSRWLEITSPMVDRTQSPRLSPLVYSWSLRLNAANAVDRDVDSCRNPLTSSPT